MPGKNPPVSGWLVPLADIAANPGQPRDDFTAIAELAGSIDELGLLQPILLREHPDQAVARWLIVSGERRFRAHHHLGRKMIAATLDPDVDARSLALKALAENLGRVDMNAIEEAQAFGELRDVHGVSVAEIAKTATVTTAYVGWRIDLLGLTDELRRMVVAKQVRPDAAWTIAKLPPEVQRYAAQKWIAGEFGMDAEAFKKYVDLLVDAQAQPEMFTAAGNATPQEREARTRLRRKTKGAVEQLAAGLAKLGPLRDMNPSELADALQGDIGPTMELLKAAKTTITNLNRDLRTAQEILRVRADLQERPTEEVA